jgi:hypothetical protein
MTFCDVCKKATDQVAFKLLITAPPSSGSSMHSNYTHHADVGTCCQGRVKQIINFKPRMTRAQYNAKRKLNSGVAKELEQEHRAEGKAKVKS